MDEMMANQHWNLVSSFKGDGNLFNSAYQQLTFVQGILPLLNLQNDWEKTLLAYFILFAHHTLLEDCVNDFYKELN